MAEDKTLVCRDCGREFVFTVGEREFFEEKGFANEPQRCPECRRARRRGAKRERVMYEVVCAGCGNVDTVPFEPRQDRAVYCGECYAKMRGRQKM